MVELTQNANIATIKRHRIAHISECEESNGDVVLSSSFVTSNFIIGQRNKALRSCVFQKRKKTKEKIRARVTIVWPSFLPVYLFFNTQTHTRTHTQEPGS